MAQHGKNFLKVSTQTTALDVTGSNQFFHFTAARLTTQKTKIQLEHLVPCESYLISVAVTGPKGPGPLALPPLRYETGYNEDSPPRNVQIKMNASAHEMLLTWENDCAIQQSRHPKYIITITELTYNKTAKVELKPSDAKVMSHKFGKIQNGGIFNVSIKTTGAAAEAYVEKVMAPPLPSPRQLKVYPEPNGTFVVHWREITDANERFTYQLVVVEGLEMNESLTPVLTMDAKIPPLFLNPTELSGWTAGTVYTLGVRLKSDAVSESYEFCVLNLAWQLITKFNGDYILLSKIKID